MESFILFTNNGTVITEDFMFHNVKEAFIDYMAYDGYTLDEIVRRSLRLMEMDTYQAW